MPRYQIRRRYYRRGANFRRAQKYRTTYDMRAARARRKRRIDRLKKMNKVRNQIHREGLQISPTGKGAKRLLTKFKYIRALYPSLIPSQAGRNLVYHRLRGNGPWDPDSATSLETAYRWNAVTADWQEQITYASKVRLTIHSDAASDDGKLIVCLIPAVEGVDWYTNADYAGIQLQPYGKNVVVGQSSGGKDLKYVSHYMSTQKMFGVDKEAITNDSPYASATSTLPALQWYWNIVITTLDGVTLDPKYIIRAEVTYYTELFTPVPTYDQ